MKVNFERLSLTAQIRVSWALLSLEPVKFGVGLDLCQTTSLMSQKPKSCMIEREKVYCEFGARRLETVNFEDSEIARSAFDVKPIRVSMTEMIQAGYFVVGEAFCLKNGQVCATLQSDGKLLYDGKILDMHSCAALASGSRAKRLNGFDVWHVLREGGLVSIASIRENYRAFIKTLRRE